MGTVMAIYLLVNGKRLDPETSEQDHLAFRVHLPVRDIRLISGHATPSAIAVGDDHRRLGVALRGLCWRQGKKEIERSIASPAFIDGFHILEHYNDREGPFRWTNGDAGLPPAIFPRWRGETLLHLRLFQWVGSTLPTSSKPEAALLSAFENLGENCELALAQRHYGVEPPLTLLRWAGTSFDNLRRGLENRFLGLGNPETTEVVWEAIDYRLRTPYLNFHTTSNKRRDAAGVAEILGTGCVTLRLLRRKLLADIADARRIFVFRTADPTFGQAEMHQLHGALRVIGPASLLCVTLAKPQQPTASVERVATGLYSGCLERFVIPDGPFDEWLALCSRTLALHYAG
jgi:hypothetical protein